MPIYSPGLKVSTNEKVINIEPKQLMSSKPVQIRIKTVKKEPRDKEIIRQSSIAGILKQARYESDAERKSYDGSSNNFYNRR